MPELPDDDPRIEQFNQRLMNLLAKFVGMELSDATLYRIQTMITNERVQFKIANGYDIPKLVILSMPTSRHLGIFRADLESTEIQTVVINMLREFGVRRVPVDRRELAIAIHRAWPYYDPSLAIDMAGVDGQAKPSLRN